MNKLMLLFNPILWFFIFCTASILLLSLIVVGGWDAGVPFTTIRYGKSITRTFHYRSFVLFFFLAAFCIYKYDLIFSGFIPFYLTFVTVFGCYGLSEFFVDIIHVQIGFETPLSFFKDMFYWCQYLFQLVILYMFTVEPFLSSFSKGVWDSRGKRWIVRFLVIALVTFILAHLYFFKTLFNLSIPPLIVPFFSGNRWTLGFFYKMFLVLSFASYVEHWRVIK